MRKSLDLIPVGGGSKLLFHTDAELVWRDDLDVGAIPQDVHREFVVLREGNGQHQMASRLDELSLLGMPDLTGDSARDVRFKAQDSRVRRGTGEDPIAAAKVRIEHFIGDLVRWSVADLGAPNRVQGKAAKAVAQMAPGIQVPVRPVVNQTLWRDLTNGFFVTEATPVPQVQTVPGQGRHAHQLETFDIDRTGCHVQDANPAPNLVGLKVLGAE